MRSDGTNAAPASGNPGPHADPFPTRPGVNARSARRFFGGPPLWVLLRLVMLSILIGVVLSALGFDAANLWLGLRQLAQALWDMGWDAVGWVWRYFLLGAVLVIPVWLVMRIAKAAGAGR